MTSREDNFQTDFPVPTFPVIFRYDPTDAVDSLITEKEEQQRQQQLPAIFSKDPGEWTLFLDQNVQILLDDDATKFGVVHTIDPVSETVVLANRADDAGGGDGRIKMELLPGHRVKEISILSKADDSLLRDLARLFGDDSSSTSSSSSSAMSKEALDARRDEVREWLVANRIPVESGGLNGDVIQVAGNALIIKPPYDVEHCYSLNEIILKKVQHLLSNRNVSQ